MCQITAMCWSLHLPFTSVFAASLCSWYYCGGGQRLREVKQLTSGFTEKKQQDPYSIFPSLPEPKAQVHTQAFFCILYRLQKSVVLQFQKSLTAALKKKKAGLSSMHWLNPQHINNLGFRKAEMQL